MVPVSAAKKNNEIVVSFAEAKELLANGNKSLIGFELLTDKGIALPAVARIEGKNVYLEVAGDVKIKAVRYAWQPFSRANLINEAGLPTSTFSIPVNKSN